MTKHVLDHNRPRSGKTMRHFSQLDALMRAEPRKQAQVIRRMPKKLDGGERLRRYLWIARHAE
jgi:hypothetical protein